MLKGNLHRCNTLTNTFLTGPKTLLFGRTLITRERSCPPRACGTHACAVSASRMTAHLTMLMLHCGPGSGILTFFWEFI